MKCPHCGEAFPALHPQSGVRMLTLLDMSEKGFTATEAVATLKMKAYQFQTYKFRLREALRRDGFDLVLDIDTLKYKLARKQEDAPANTLG